MTLTLGHSVRSSSGVQSHTLGFLAYFIATTKLACRLQSTKITQLLSLANLSYDDLKGLAVAAFCERALPDTSTTSRILLLHTTGILCHKLITCHSSNCCKHSLQLTSNNHHWVDSFGLSRVMYCFFWECMRYTTGRAVKSPLLLQEPATCQRPSTLANLCCFKT